MGLSNWGRGRFEHLRNQGRLESLGGRTISWRQIGCRFEDLTPLRKHDGVKQHTISAIILGSLHG
jgi:hypothetical protein